MPCRGSHNLLCPRASDLGIAPICRVLLVASATYLPINKTQEKLKGPKQQRITHDKHIPEAKKKELVKNLLQLDREKGKHNLEKQTA